MKKKILFLSLILFLIPYVKVNAASVNYSTHVQNIGWQDYVKDDEMSGTSGLALRLEGIIIKLSDLEYEGGIEYSTHVQNVGWMDYVSDGDLSGTTGRALRLEGIKIRLTGELADHYNIFYQVHVQNVGWMNYVSNDELAGTTGRALRLEGIRIKLVSKDDSNSEPHTISDIEEPTIPEIESQETVSIKYASSVQNMGWQDYVSDGELSGTSYQAKYIDQIKIKVNKGNLNGDVQYKTFNYKTGWSDYVSDDSISGISKQQIEAVKIKLTGELSEQYDVYYRVHVSNIGWMAWTYNDLPTGTNGCLERVEGIQILLTKKGTSNIDTDGESYREIASTIKYSSHVSNIGWQDYVDEGEMSGTTGRALRIEAIKIKLDTKLPGSIKYQTYIAKRGWSEENMDDEISGTTGLARNIEAIKIKLDGDISNYFDIYYRTHNSCVGWVSWAKNGEISGSLYSDTRVEAIEIKLVRKNTSFDGDTSKPYVTGHWSSDGKKYYDYFENPVTGFRLIDGVKYYFNQEGILYGTDVMKAVDVSSWQYHINWDLIKANEDVDKAIIRVGWGTSYADECGLDSEYDYNIQNIQRLGIPYDVYIYAYAETEAAAIKEADFMINNLQRYNVPKDTYIWYDAELDIPFDIYKTVIPIFVNRMKEAGYNNVGVYSSVVRLDTAWGNLNDPTIRSYPIWVAQYYRKNQYDGEYKIWQFQSDGQIDGIDGNVDVNMYKK